MESLIFRTFINAIPSLTAEQKDVLIHKIVKHWYQQLPNGHNRIGCLKDIWSDNHLYQTLKDAALVVAIVQADSIHTSDPLPITH